MSGRVAGWTTGKRGILVLQGEGGRIGRYSQETNLMSLLLLNPSSQALSVTMVRQAPQKPARHEEIVPIIEDRFYIKESIPILEEYLKEQVSEP